MPAAPGTPLHAGRLDADLQVNAFGHRQRGEIGVEPGAVEDPAHVTLGNSHFGVIGGDEDDLRDLSGDPRRSPRVGELPQSRVAHPLGATHRGADGPVPLDQQDIELGGRVLGLPRRDRPGGAGTDHEDVEIPHAAGTMARAPTGQGAMHLRQPVQVSASTTRSLKSR